MTGDPFTTADVLQANPGLVVALGLALGPAVVLGILAVMMRLAGASLRPIVFIAGLMAPIVVVFIAGQLVMARVPQDAHAGAGGLAVEDGRFADREAVFGADIPQAMVRDARDALPGILDGAEAAEAGVTLSGETVLAAQFPDAGQARRAAAAYHQGFDLRGTSGGESGGWKAMRMQGDFIEMLLAGRNLFVWSGPTPEAAAARRAVSRLPEAVAPEPAKPLFPALQPLEVLFSSVVMTVLGLLVMVAIYTAWFFTGATWVSSAGPASGVPVLSCPELAGRLLAINDLPVSFTVSPGRTSREFFADWRYADAAWLDLARARKLRKTFRIRMELDEASKTVRAADYTSEIDLSAGFDGASLAWKAAVGIVFFQREQEKVFGLQLNGDGEGKKPLSYTYRFDLNEMKAPIIAVVTRSGWTWRPTLIPWGSRGAGGAMDSLKA